MTPRSTFMRDEEGAILPFGLMLFVLCFVVGGIAVDVSNAYQARTHLQVAADSAAHAALVVRETEDADTARQMALDVAQASMPVNSFGATLRSEDILFGYWDAENAVFTPDETSRDAVLVETAQISERLNPAATFFMQFIGRSSWDIRTQSVFETYFPTCLREGFVADDVVEITSNNYFTNGFCIHANAYVDLNNNTVFDPGTIVSMPDKRNLNGPNDVIEKNPGLGDALRDGSYKLRILSRIESIIAGVEDPRSIYYPDYITDSRPVSPKKKDKLDSTFFQPGHIYEIACSSSKKQVNIEKGTLLKELVIATNCQIKFGQGVALEDVIITNSNTSDDSFNAANGLRLGRDDNCGVGGGAQLVTMGGVKIPSGLEMYGGQIIAAGDVSFTANANGIQGASIIAGGRIDGTANGEMAFCGTGMEDNFEAAYFRLAR